MEFLPALDMQDYIRIALALLCGGFCIVAAILISQIQARVRRIEAQLAALMDIQNKAR